MLEGVRLMAVGMTAVFAFLVLLVALMYASAWIFGRYGSRFDAPADAPTAEPQPFGRRDSDAEIALVLAIAENARRSAGRQS